jgi:RIO kinase 1
MSDPLAPLLADGVVDEVCGRLKSGKEAELWLVRHGGELVAAKVYKAREARSFRNDAEYREGRRVRNSRTQRAMDKGSRFGQAAAEQAWKAKEADALHALHAAGVRVPRPILFYEGVLLMELVVDAQGRPAPRLVDAHLAREHAAALYADLRGQAVRMLACDLVHGDLSPYNVLLGRDGPVVIDFPQVVGAAHNRQAESFFRRDLENLRRFFAALDPALCAAEQDAREIWRAYERRELTADFVPAARPAGAPPPGRHGHAHGPPAHAPGHHGQRHPRHAPHHPRPAPAPAPRPPERGAGRRGRGPGPEVVRVSRPALAGAPPGPAGSSPPRHGEPPRAGGGPAPRHADPHRPGGEPAHPPARRRRRRRR